MKLKSFLICCAVTLTSLITSQEGWGKGRGNLPYLHIDWECIKQCEGEVNKSDGWNDCVVMNRPNEPRCQAVLGCFEKKCPGRYKP